ncbi:MAG TPA: low temperature requirement protein A, partial [Micromonosporaceae bacterium]|nr:low temperature requirement protein A [Micromonosporaceae bacterium]
AVAQVAHTIVAEPRWGSVWMALGLFVVLWWTWIGFTTLYNRYGDDSLIGHRLLIVGATVPCGLAAVAVHDAAHGHRMAFALSLAGVRVLLAVAHFVVGGKLPRRIALGYCLSAVGFAVSAFVGAPWWWILWTLMVVGESLNLFRGEIGRLTTGERRKLLEREGASGLKAFAPTDPAFAVDAHHLSERFGLFVIIMLGEVVASAGQGMLAGDGHGAQAWATLAGGIALAGALWWIYFDSTADVSRRYLELSSGSPEVARAVFAAGHMIPAFALIVVAAGLRLLLQGHPPTAAYWLVAAGIGAYLVGTRVVTGATTTGNRLLRLVLVVGTFQLGHLAGVLSSSAFTWLVCGWVVVCAAAASYHPRVAQAI